MSFLKTNRIYYKRLFVRINTPELEKSSRMAQPPPRKGAYNKFVLNLHKEQYGKLQAKNQQELDLLDDIRIVVVIYLRILQIKL